jgi:hypothetical protein
MQASRGLFRPAKIKFLKDVQFFICDVSIVCEDADDRMIGGFAIFQIPVMFLPLQVRIDSSVPLLERAL